MSEVFIVFSFLLFIAFIIGLARPSIFLGPNNPKKSRIFWLFFLPSLVLFYLAGRITNQEYEEAWANPQGVTRLMLSKKDLSRLPPRLIEFKSLKELVLRDNNITVLDEQIFKSMPKLKHLDLENNPIEKVPDWIADLQLERLILNGTRVQFLSENIRTATDRLEYKNTPLSLKEEEAYQTKKDSLATAPRTESFGDYALRKIRGMEYGYQRNFKKGILFYTEGVPPERIDSLGAFLLRHGYFSDERNVVMQLKYNDRKGFNAYELRVIYAEEEEPLDDELKRIFQFLSEKISREVLDGLPVHFHLTDFEFDESVYVFKSDQNGVVEYMNK